MTGWLGIANLIATVVVILLAPIIALWVGGRLERRRERERLKLLVFGTLIQTRHDPVSPEAVKHLNLIDLIFADDRGVRDAWSQYYAVLSDGRLQNDAGFAIRDDRKVNLLRVMAESMGYGTQISTSDLLRTYVPNSELERQHLEMLERQLRLRDALAERNRRQTTGSPASSPEDEPSPGGQEREPSSEEQ